MGRIIQLNEYKVRYQKARFRWRATGCNYRTLSRDFGISLDRARRWELQFMKEKTEERKKK